MAERHVGIHAHRIADSPLEGLFAKQWREDCKRGRLEHLLKCVGVGDVSPRDEAVAATIIQWLGSHVGQGFLHAVATADAKRKRKDHNA